MMTIKCAKCKKKLFKYHKIGKGRILRVWLARLDEDFTKRNGDKVLCQCGAHVGNLDNLKIRMKQSAFTYSGTYE